MMMRLPPSLLQILFLTRITSIEHYWVILGKRRGNGRNAAMAVLNEIGEA
jgi:hypothetical protein